jgi:putative exosortase-associated protein (TIGR04073 family)
MFCAAVQAADPTPLNGEAAMSLTPSVTKGPYYDQSTSERATRKLVRGIANVTLCVAEIPNQMFQEAYRTSPITGSVVGAWNGLVKGSQRLVIGLWEVATFYHPGKNNYQPYIDPEIVFMEYLH